jgi:large subunit ribosomal protein L22
MGRLQREFWRKHKDIMEATANIKYQKISDKKIKYLAREVVGKGAEQTVERLTLLGNKAAHILSKSIKSAISNMKNKGITDVSTVKILNVSIGKGPFLKRWNPVSRGMAHQIKKRTSHIKVVLQNKAENSKNIIESTKKKGSKYGA